MEKLSNLLPSVLQLDPKWKRSGYTAISNKILFRADVSVGAKVVYWYLLIRCFTKDYSYPSYETIAKDLRVGRASVARYIVELKEKHLVEVKHRRNKSNLYFLKT